MFAFACDKRIQLWPVQKYGGESLRTGGTTSSSSSFLEGQHLNYIELNEWINETLGTDERTVSVRPKEEKKYQETTIQCDFRTKALFSKRRQWTLYLIESKNFAEKEWQFI